MKKPGRHEIKRDHRKYSIIFAAIKYTSPRIVPPNVLACHANSWEEMAHVIEWFNQQHIKYHVIRNPTVKPDLPRAGFWPFALVKLYTINDRILFKITFSV